MIGEWQGNRKQKTAEPILKTVESGAGLDQPAEDDAELLERSSFRDSPGRESLELPLANKDEDDDFRLDVESLQELEAHQGEASVRIDVRQPRDLHASEPRKSKVYTYSDTPSRSQRVDAHTLLIGPLCAKD